MIISSPLMRPKLMEMDNVIKSIYNYVFSSDKSTAIFILGDHGMTDSGNHGGSSPEEIDTACLVIMNQMLLPKKPVPDVIDQLDIAPIIASLFGVPIPKDNVGRVAPSFLHSLDPKTKMKHLVNNLSQLASGGATVAIEDVIDCYQSNCTFVDCDNCIHVAESRIREAQKHLSSNVGSYNLPVLLACLFISFMTIMFMFSRGSYSSNVLPMVLYCLSVFSSSFIEEEHEIWNHLIPMLIMTSKNKPLLTKTLALFAARALRYWNSNGYEYRSFPDMKVFLTKHPGLMFSLLAASLIYCSKGNGSFLQISKLSLSGLIFMYKLDWTKSSYLGRIIISGTLILALFDSRSLYLLLMAVQKAHNALPFVLLELINSTIDHSDVTVALLHYSYFSLGMSNLITSIDLSNSYIGLTDYEPAWVALMTFIISFSGPIHALITCNYIVNLSDAMTWRSAVQFSVMLCCFIQRHHISIWTVFTPRLLFEALWTMFYILAAFYMKMRLINK